MPRAGASRIGNAKKSLAQLREAKLKGEKRTAQVQFQEAAAFDEFTEEEYQKRMEKERERGGFIVDDSGTGLYNEYGDEWLDDDEDELVDDDLLGEPGAKKTKVTRKGIFNTAPKKSQVVNKAPASQRITKIFMGGVSSDVVTKPKNDIASSQSTTSAKPTKRVDKEVVAKGMGSLMEDFMKDIGEQLPSKKRQKKKSSSKSSATDQVFNKVAKSSSKFKTPAPVKKEKTTPKKAEKEKVFGDAAEDTPDAKHLKQTTIEVEPIDDADLWACLEQMDQATATTSVGNNAKSASTVKIEDLNDDVGEWRAAVQEEEEEEDQSPSTAIPSSEDALQLFWFDIAESKYANPGTIYIFGKTYVPDESRPGQKKCISCSVVVNNINTVLYVAPKPGYEIADVRAEMEEIRQKYKIKKWMTKQVKRSYCFDNEDVAREPDSPFLKIIIAPNECTLPNTLTGKTFGAVFGLGQSAIEQFIMKKKLMGPCWLSISQFNAVTSLKRTHCKMEVTCDDMAHIAKTVSEQPLAPPPFKVLSLCLKTALNHKDQDNEVVMVSGILHSSVNIDKPTPSSSRLTCFSATRKLDGVIVPFQFEQQIQKQSHPIQICANERHLMSFLVNKLINIDPDVIVGHNFIGFDLDVLLHRMNKLKISQWSILGRLKRSVMPKLQAGAGGTTDSTYGEKAVTSGRLICDTYLSSKEFLGRERSYKLSSLAKSQLGLTKVDVDRDEIPNYFTDVNKLVQLVKHNENDAFVALSLMFKLEAIPLTHQLTSLSGNLWSRSLMGGRAERIEYLLLHKLHNMNYLPPPKRVPAKKDDKKDSNPAKKKAAYAGGLVLEPKRGFYDKLILLLDFNSLYPSIIQEYNICFTTVQRHRIAGSEDDWELSNPPESGLEPGILPSTIRTLVDQRRQVKAQMKKEQDPVKKNQLNIRQLALKLTANSMYGCLGFTYSRFYAKPLAELITRKGRETLQKTVDIAQKKLLLDVIYGDTDSIMIYTGLEDLAAAKEIAKSVKQEVNQSGSKLEIEVDGIFKTMLLLKKKKYAALVVNEKPDGTVTYTKETKGLDLVRRDWCDLSREMGNFVLDEILSGKSREDVVENIHSYLRMQAEIIRQNGVPRSKFIITKSLTKPPEAYPDVKGQAHVQVALKMKKAGRSIRVGDFIPYLICEGDSESFAERAFPPDQVERSDGALKLDINWYLAQQIHPPISRLCETISGTDRGQLAQCLGLDPRKFMISMDEHHDHTLPARSQMPDEERFKHCEKLGLKCHYCGKFQKLQLSSKNSFQCENETCGSPFSAGHLSNQATLLARKYQRQYYKFQLKCDEQSCQDTTRQLYWKKQSSRCTVPACKGVTRQMYTASQLYDQICYLEKLFSCNLNGQTPKYLAAAAQPAAAAMGKLRQKSQRAVVPLGELFSVFSKLPQAVKLTNVKTEPQS